MPEHDDAMGFGHAFPEVRERFTEADLDLFGALVGELLELYSNRLQALKLVGSRARGTATADSDYDFLVFLDTCDYEIEVPRLADLAAVLEELHPIGPLSLSPMTQEQFVGLDLKFEGITNNFRRDAVNLWPVRP